MVRSKVVLDPAVAAILSGPEGEAGGRPAVHKATPHERGRVTRRMSVTFPSAGWVRAIRVRTEAAGVRPSDFVTWCVAHAMGALEAGVVGLPVGHAGWQDRAGGGMALPWEPEGDGD